VGQTSGAPILLGVLDDILACPLCHAPLAAATCTGCGHRFSTDEGVLNLTPIPPPDPRVQARWQLWEELQANGRHAYEIDPPSSLSVGERPDAEAFAEFSDLQGIVLDVGCGVQALPSYGRGLEGRLVGVDPLRGQRNREFMFVEAIAEYLPFRDRTFDSVLFATSIDHVLVPQLAAAEAHRVLKTGGRVCIWLGETAAPSLRARIRRRIRPPREARVRTPRVEMTFRIPTGAVDAFHVAHPDAETVVGWLEQAGFHVEDVQRPLPGSCFVRARRAH
jgi:SAM-dependent methyltransferase